MRFGQLAVDISPLRESRDFRYAFSGRLVSMFGTAMTEVAVAVQVYQITGSSAQVGLISLVIGLVIVVATLSGGIISDRYDRRRVILVGRGIGGIAFVALTVNALLPNPSIAMIYACAVLVGLSMISGVAMMAATPAIVGRENVTAAGALVTVTTQLGAVVGPALSGVVLSWAGFAAAYGFTAVATVVTMLLLARIRPLPPGAIDGQRGARGVMRSLADGFRFVVKTPLIAGLMLIDVFAMLFAMPMALFPQLAEQVLGGGAQVAGLLYAAPGAGALISAVLSGWTGRLRRPGRVLVIAVIGWGVAMSLFGLTAAVLPAGLALVALVFLAFAGAADNISEILRRGILQRFTPDVLQGRVSSVWLAQATVAPAAGNATSGVVARFLGPVVTITAGGLVCAVGAVGTGAVFPAMWRTDTEEGTAADPGDNVAGDTGAETGDANGLVDAEQARAAAGTGSERS